MKNLLLISCILSFFLLHSCRKDESIITDASANIKLSVDTIAFDTVFATIGSITKNFRVYNPYKEILKISSIRLNGGSQSNFRMNVDGMPGNEHYDVEIAPNDSMYVFVEVTVDPNNKANPFIIEDYIEFVTNGNRKTLQLVAWGQNAHYYTPTTYNRFIPDYCCLDANGQRGPCSDAIAPVNVTWTNDLPYVIYGFVVIDSLDVLNIDPGVQIHFHNNSGLWVYRGGSIKVNGTKANPVVFQGDRLEPAYKDLPGQWDRIWINDGGQNSINYAIIKNGFIGLQVEHLPFEDPKDSIFSTLTLKNTTIDNCSGYGLISALYNIQAENLVITDCGQYNVMLQSAGNYVFNQSTFANFYTKSFRETPSFFVQNTAVNAIGTLIKGVPRVSVTNSIIYGDRTKEFATEIVNNGALDLNFNTCIIKTDENISDTTSFKNILQNPSNSIFKDEYMGDFQLNENSEARDKGKMQFANPVPLDILENSRIADGKPDLGAFEYQP
ncbi:MAG: hypothetical protein DWP98_06835 [Bacteroidetes bacterium]|nr:MAG: hypothetical protein DWP98_06835 [Bacteroidota bacterium]MBL1145636.1 hypothetical protein [Bacteroidota bacterium]NOG58430.1 hypothetical protein [Bacteroidota bacterium]